MAQNSGVPDTVLRSLSSDPEFQKLDPDVQDRMVERFAQESYGKIGGFEDILNRTAQNLSPAGVVGQPLIDATKSQLFPRTDLSSNPLIAGLQGGSQGAQAVSSAFSPFYNLMHNMKTNMLSNQISTPKAPITSGILTTVADILTNPEMFMGGEGVGQGIGKVAGASKNLKAAIGEQNTLEHAIENAGETKINLKENLSEEALRASEATKETIKNTARSNTELYRSKLEEIEQSLGDIKASKSEYINKVINPTLQEADELGLPSDSPTLQKLRSTAESWTPQTQEPETQFDWNTVSDQPKPIEPVDDSLSINDLKNLRGSISKGMGRAVKTGAQPYQPEDVASSIYLKNHGEYLGSKSDKLTALNREYRPYAQAKKWAYKTFKPGNPNEVQRGANVLSRIAQGTHNQDDLNYLEQLEKGSGRFQGTGSLRGETPTIASQIRDIDAKIEGLKTSKGNILQKMPQLQHYANVRRDLIKWGLVGVLTTVGGTIGLHHALPYILGRGAGAVATER